MTARSLHPLKLLTLAVLMCGSSATMAERNALADQSYDAFTKAFIVSTADSAHFREQLNSTKADTSWTAALDIMVAQDVYDRTGRESDKALVAKLCATWLKNTPMPWTWNEWNDDLGWYSVAMIRGYQITGNAQFLTAAKYAFDLAWDRGWDTQYNGGGIWERMRPPANEPRLKEALSNDSLGRAAVMIYQSTHDRSYLDRAVRIYDWVTANIYDRATGQVYRGVDPAGVVDKGYGLYNQGTFVEYAHLLYLVTLDKKYYNDAKRTIDYVKVRRQNNGIISNDAAWLNTWADEFGRGVGHFTRDNREWDAYYPWMQANAQSIWASRRTDRNITWNGWDKLTPRDDSFVVSKFTSAVAWLQFTPTAKPTDGIAGIHTIVNKKTGVAIDNSGQHANGTGVIQWGLNRNQNQHWLFTQNDDNSWNITSMSSWKALDVAGGDTSNGAQLIQWTPHRADNQRWWVDRQPDGSFKIWNKATQGVLDGASTTQNGARLIQWNWNGGDQQRWILN